MCLKNPSNGTVKLRDDKQYIYYSGQWILYYAPIPDTLTSKKELIDNLTKRLFHHTETGINTPGKKLGMARKAYEAETDPARKRVNGAMLAGALFNRATDIFTALVELEEKGIKISTDNDLMVMCGEYFSEALELGKHVKHYSGEEGIDELWGEPFKIFTMSVPDYYASRYLKVADALNGIDTVIKKIISVFQGDGAFDGLEPKLLAFQDAARHTCETMKSDPETYKAWPLFVTTGDEITDFNPELPLIHDTSNYRQVRIGNSLLKKGRNLIDYISGARVPLPVSTKIFLDRCERYLKCRQTGLWEQY